MSSPRASRASPRNSKKKDALASPAMRRTVRRAHVVIEAMFWEIRKGMLDPAYCETKAWDKVFGSKQTMVANLLKLVAAMASLPVLPFDPHKQEDAQAEAPLTQEEMELLTAWLGDKDREA